MNRSLRRVSPAASHDLAIAFALAVLICLFRLSLFDYLIFKFRAFPSHDSLTAAGMFASSVQSTRLTGDIAWWLPSEQGGYAQYFNAFLSPLAPTSGNIVFMLWLDAGRVLGWLHIVVPEYQQFLIFELVLMPVVAYTALLLLMRRFCRGWLGPALCAGAYAVSGTGLWNNAWMFYQEWANIFFLLFAFDLFACRPAPRSAAVLGLAALSMASSANYWTLFSLWFLATFFIAYASCHWARVSALLRSATWRLVLSAPLDRAACGLLAVAVLGWFVLVGSVYREQAASFVRYGNKPAGYTMEQVYGRSQTGGMGRFTAELFQPVPAPPPDGYLIGNWMHTAGYIGLGLLPPIVAYFAMPWAGIDMILFSLLTVSVVVASGSGVFIGLWRLTPGMHALLHAFYFYSYFVELTLLMIAGLSLDRIVGRRTRTPVLAGLAGCGLLGLLSLAYVFSAGTSGVIDTPALNSFSYAGIFLVACSAALLKAATSQPKAAGLLGLIVVLVVLGDLGRYYYVVADKDRYFTFNFRKIQLEQGYLPKPLMASLRRVWSIADVGVGFAPNLFANMPVASTLWPDNDFNPSQAVRDYRALDATAKAHITPLKAMSEIAAPSQEREPNSVAEAAAGVPDYRFEKAGYNRFIFGFNHATASDILLKLAYDPNWHVTVNGTRVDPVRVNGWMTAIPVPAGHSEVMLDFEPFSRRLYLPLRYLTYLACFSLLLAALRNRTEASHFVSNRNLESSRWRGAAP